MTDHDSVKLAEEYEREWDAMVQACGEDPHKIPGVRLAANPHDWKWEVTVGGLTRDQLADVVAVVRAMKAAPKGYKAEDLFRVAAAEAFAREFMDRAQVSGPQSQMEKARAWIFALARDVRVLRDLARTFFDHIPRDWWRANPEVAKAAGRPHLAEK